MIEKTYPQLLDHPGFKKYLLFIVSILFIPHNMLPIPTAIWMAMVVFTFPIFTHSYGYIIAVIKQNLFLSFFVVLCIISTFWSISKTPTLINASHFAALAIIGILIGLFVSVEELTDVIKNTIVIVCIICFMIMTFSSFQESVFGIFANKNVCGKYMSFALLIGLIPSSEKNGFLGLRELIIVIVSAIFLAYVDSSTSILSVIAGVLVVPLAKFIPRMKYILIVGGITIYLLYQNQEYLLSVVGRDISLTGRVPLWAYLMMSLQGHEIFGFGFSAFFTNKETVERLEMIGFPWAVHAHNGLIDNVMGTGYVGGALLVAGTISGLTRAFQLQRNNKGLVFSLPFMVITWTIVENFAEVTFYSMRAPFWVLFVSMLAISWRAEIKQFSKNAPIQKSANHQRSSVRILKTQTPSRV